MLCETCEKREYCSELCPEAEAYVNQDYVPQKHLIPLRPITFTHPFPNTTSSPIRLILIDYFINRKTQLEIANTLKISQQYVSKVIIKHKDILIKAIKESVNL